MWALRRRPYRLRRNWYSCFSRAIFDSGFCTPLSSRARSTGRRTPLFLSCPRGVWHACLLSTLSPYYSAHPAPAPFTHTNSLHPLKIGNHRRRSALPPCRKALSGRLLEGSWVLGCSNAGFAGGRKARRASSWCANCGCSGCADEIDAHDEIDARDDCASDDETVKKATTKLATDATHPTLRARRATLRRAHGPCDVRRGNRQRAAAQRTADRAARSAQRMRSRALRVAQRPLDRSSNRIASRMNASRAGGYRGGLALAEW